MKHIAAQTLGWAISVILVAVIVISVVNELRDDSPVTCNGATYEADCP